MKTKQKQDVNKFNKDFEKNLANVIDWKICLYAYIYMLISNIWSQIYSRFTKDLNAKEKTKQKTAVLLEKNMLG